MLHRIKWRALRSKIIECPAPRDEALVAEFWRAEVRTKGGSSFFNGVIFELLGVSGPPSELEFTFRRSSFAEMLYARRSGDGFKFCHTAVLVYDDGASFIAVVMNDATLGGSRLVLPGGALDEMDLRDDQIDFASAAQREVQEEISLSISSSDFDDEISLIVSSDGRRHSLVFHLKVPSCEELLRNTLRRDPNEIQSILVLSPAALRQYRSRFQFDPYFDDLFPA